MIQLYSRAIRLHQRRQYDQAFELYQALLPETCSALGSSILAFNSALCLLALQQFDEAVSLLVSVYRSEQSLRANVSALLLRTVFQRKQGSTHSRSLVLALFQNPPSEQSLLPYYAMACYLRGLKHQSCQLLHQHSLQHPSDSSIVNYLRVREELRQKSKSDCLAISRQDIERLRQQAPLASRSRFHPQKAQSSHYRRRKLLSRAKMPSREGWTASRPRPRRSPCPQPKLTKEANTSASPLPMRRQRAKPLVKLRLRSIRQGLIELSEQIKEEPKKQIEVQVQQVVLEKPDQTINVTPATPSTDQKESPPALLVSRSFSTPCQSLSDCLRGLNEEDPESYRRVGEHYLRLGRKEHAASYFQKSLSIEKNDQSMLQLAKIYSETGQETLLASGLDLLRHCRPSTDRDFLIAETQLKLHNFETAEGICEGRLQVHSRAYSRFKRVYVSALRGQLKIQQAVIQATQFCKQPLDVESLLQLSDLFKSCQAEEQAQQLLRRAAAEYPENDHVRVKLAQHQAGHGETGTALGLLQSAFRHNPTDRAVYTAFVDLLVQQGRVESACKVLNQVIQQEPGDTQPRMRLLYLLEDNGVVEQREELLQSLEGCMSGDQFRWHQANLSYDSREYNEAKRLYVSVKSLELRLHDVLRFRLANINCVEYRFERALELYRLLLGSRVVDRNVVLFNIGNVYLLTNNVAKAVAAFEMVEGELRERASYNVFVSKVLLNDRLGIESAFAQVSKAKGFKPEWRHVFRRVKEKGLSCQQGGSVLSTFF